ncbi:hypothetical protein [Plantibacter flavus]|uniref:hypothetical protein n=1 Tax=Plantibacter flavus TaxID=150123 RepID=UPI00129480DC|nr:hypothetical protein [Plantibacter flavus]
MLRRPAYLTDAEFEPLHDLLASPPEVDVVLDVSGFTIDRQLEAIRGVWSVSR